MSSLSTTTTIINPQPLAIEIRATIKPTPQENIAFHGNQNGLTYIAQIVINDYKFSHELVLNQSTRIGLPKILPPETEAVIHLYTRNSLSDDGLRIVHTRCGYGMFRIGDIKLDKNGGSIDLPLLRLDNQTKLFNIHITILAMGMWIAPPSEITSTAIKTGGSIWSPTMDDSVTKALLDYQKASEKIITRYENDNGIRFVNGRIADPLLPLVGTSYRPLPIALFFNQAAYFPFDEFGDKNRTAYLDNIAKLVLLEHGWSIRTFDGIFRTWITSPKQEEDQQFLRHICGSVVRFTAHLKSKSPDKWGENFLPTWKSPVLMNTQVDCEDLALECGLTFLMIRKEIEGVTTPDNLTLIQKIAYYLKSYNLCYLIVTTKGKDSNIGSEHAVAVLLDERYLREMGRTVKYNDQQKFLPPIWLECLERVQFCLDENPWGFSFNQFVAIDPLFKPYRFLNELLDGDPLPTYGDVVRIYVPSNPQTNLWHECFPIHSEFKQLGFSVRSLLKNDRSLRYYDILLDLSERQTTMNVLHSFSKKAFGDFNNLWYTSTTIATPGSDPIPGPFESSDRFFFVLAEISDVSNNKVQSAVINTRQKAQKIYEFEKKRRSLSSSSSSSSFSKDDMANLFTIASSFDAKLEKTLFRIADGVSICRVVSMKHRVIY